MRQELDEKLCKEFPNLYGDRYQSPQATCMCWGFCCGDGWYDIIYDLSKVLEPNGIVASQVKEKFGTLRFYICGGDENTDHDAVRAAIDKAEELSTKTCEYCGKPGSLRSGSWLKTLCDECKTKEL